MVTKVGVLLNSDLYRLARYVPEIQLKHKVLHCGQMKEISRPFGVPHRQMFCKCCMKNARFDRLGLHGGAPQARGLSDRS